MQAGAVAAFIQLLDCRDVDVQFYCAAALSNIAVNGEGEGEGRGGEGREGRERGRGRGGEGRGAHFLRSRMARFSFLSPPVRSERTTAIIYV